MRERLFDHSQTWTSHFAIAFVSQWVGKKRPLQLTKSQSELYRKNWAFCRDRPTQTDATGKNTAQFRQILRNRQCQTLLSWNSRS